MLRIHLDHNATTPMRPEAREEFARQLDQLGGNPSSVHRSGRAARAVLDDARERVAGALGVHEDEVVFTGSGTECVNLALLGALRPQAAERALVTTAIEHAAALGAAEALRGEGRRVELLGVDDAGRLALDEFRARASAPDVGLVSVMAANNEVGTIQPIEELVNVLSEAFAADSPAAPGRPEGARPIGPTGVRNPDPKTAQDKRFRPLFHTDAVQALGRIPVALRAWGVDLASFSAHKVGGPLGVGVLYKRKGVALASLAHGGGQEGGLRPGTENVPAISAAAVAIELALCEEPAARARWRELTSMFWRQLHAVVPDVRLNGPAIDAADRLPNTLNLSVPGFEARMLVARLDLEGLEVSAGSACASGSLEPSHVLLAMRRSRDDARGGLRVSLGRSTSAQDIHTAVDILSRVLSSPR